MSFDPLEVLNRIRGVKNEVNSKDDTLSPDVAQKNETDELKKELAQAYETIAQQNKIISILKRELEESQQQQQKKRAQESMSKPSVVTTHMKSPPFVPSGTAGKFRFASTSEKGRVKLPPSVQNQHGISRPVISLDLGSIISQEEFSNRTPGK